MQPDRGFAGLLARLLTTHRRGTRRVPGGGGTEAAACGASGDGGDAGENADCEMAAKAALCVARTIQRLVDVSVQARTTLRAAGVLDALCTSAEGHAQSPLGALCTAILTKVSPYSGLSPVFRRSFCWVCKPGDRITRPAPPPPPEQCQGDEGA